MKKEIAVRLLRLANVFQKLGEGERPQYSEELKLFNGGEKVYRAFWCGQGNVVALSPKAVAELNKFVTENFIAEITGPKQATIITKAEVKRQAAVSNTKKTAAPDKWEVLVGNIGIVYAGPDAAKAKAEYMAYVELSQDPRGRAAGEDVTLVRNGNVYDEYFGSDEEDEPDEE